jgi:hypothetical protein
LLSEQRAGGCQNQAINGNGPHTMNAFQTMWLYYRRLRDKVNQLRKSATPQRVWVYTFRESGSRREL